MLLFVIVALLVLAFTLSLHFCQHFGCKCGSEKTKIHHERKNAQLQVQPIQRQIQMNLLRKTNHMYIKCCCSIKPLNEFEFDFFPMSFLWYLLFMIILCFLIIITELLKHFIYSKSTRFIDVSLDSSFTEIQPMNTIHILDYIIIYGILILCIWASLFSFYRYLSTLNSATKLRSLSTKKLFKKFTIYAVIFCIIFVIQIHVYYWIFSALIVMFCGFNFYCTHKFAAILVKQFQQFTNAHNNQYNFNPNFEKDMNNMLYSTLFTKYISLICCGLQSIELTLFVITYNVAIIHYLTILWSISGFIFSLTFIRNRMFLKQKMTKLKNLFKAHTNSQSEKVSIQTSKEELINVNSTNVLAIQLVQDKSTSTSTTSPSPYKKQISFTPKHVQYNNRPKLTSTTYSNPSSPANLSATCSIESTPSPIVPQYKKTVSLNTFPLIDKPQLKSSNSDPIKISTEGMKDDNELNAMENFRRAQSSVTTFESNTRFSTNTVRALSVNMGYMNMENEQKMENVSPLVLKDETTMIANATSGSTPIILENEEHDYGIAIDMPQQSSESLLRSPEIEEILNTFGTLTRCGFLSPTNANTFHFSAFL